MWKKLKTSNLFLSYSENYEIHVIDYVTIWFSYLSRCSFIRCLKDSNSLLENMSDEAMIKKGFQMLSNPGDLKTLETKFEDKTLKIVMTMRFGYNFRLILKLCEGSKELFFQKVTQPFLKTILELKNSQLELCQLLKKKDSEIEEYKCEGGEIAIKHLKTKPFNEGATLSKYKSFQEQFGSSNDMLHGLIQMVVEFPEDLKHVKSQTNEVVTIQSEPPVIKKEPQNIKTEANLQMSGIKIEQSEQISNIKTESNSLNSNVKVEPESQVVESQSVPSVSASFNIKQEPDLSVKRESQISITNGRKKIRKFF